MITLLSLSFSRPETRSDCLCLSAPSTDWHTEAASSRILTWIVNNSCLLHWKVLGSYPLRFYFAIVRISVASRIPFPRCPEHWRRKRGKQQHLKRVFKIWHVIGKIIYPHLGLFFHTFPESYSTFCLISSSLWATLTLNSFQQQSFVVKSCPCYASI